MNVPMVSRWSGLAHSDTSTLKGLRCPCRVLRVRLLQSKWESLNVSDMETLSPSGRFAMFETLLTPTDLLRTLEEFSISAPRKPSASANVSKSSAQIQKCLSGLLRTKRASGR